MEKTCLTCALAQRMGADGTCLCLKYKRIRLPDETGWDWGCRYFSLIMPEEQYEPYQYLLIRETEINTRK
ncbi:MAG: hypothetical protein ABSC17_10130 [Thermacetogeniaceae bacterium]